MHKASDKLVELVRKVVEPMGYELVGVEHVTGQGRAGLLRVYIDKEEGITLDDCEKVSHQLSGTLDVEDPIAGEYSLEISSPGLDRPLFELSQYERFVGQKVSIRLTHNLEGRRRFKGVLKGIEGGDVLIEMDGETYVLPFDLIDTARLVPEF